MPHPTVQILQEFLHQQALPKSAVKPVAGKTQSAVYPKSILEEVVELTTDIAQLKFESVEPKENHFEILSKFLSTHEEVESIPVLLELYKHQFIQKHVKQRLIRCFTLLVDDMKQIYIAMLEKIDDAEFRQILEEIQEAYVSKRLRVNRTLTGDLKMSVTQFGQWVTDEKRLFAQLFTIDIYYTYLIEQLTLRLNSRCYPIITSQTSPQVLSDYCHFLKTNSFASSLLANAQEQLAARAEKVVAQILSFKPKGQEMLIFTRKMELPKPNTLIVDRGSGEFYPTCSSSVTLLQNLYEALPVSLP